MDGVRHVGWGKGDIHLIPVDHWVLSWQQGECPSAEQSKEATEIFLKRLGLEGHQAVWAVHANTQNTHLHIAVNRVNKKMVSPKLCLGTHKV